MKTFKNLYPQIHDFENLLLAAKKAQKGKRFQANVAKFNYRLEPNLLALQKELATCQYQPGGYTTFYIQEPKERMISAAPYRDRVVHHALCNVLEPIFERFFIHDTYANRKDKGTHKAVLRYQQFAKQNTYVLKCDIKKYFPSIDHEILTNSLFKKIACPKTRWLISTILANSNAQEPHVQYFAGDELFSPTQRRMGLPIGNLTSQLFANIYLSPLDHFIKRELKAGAYIRYVDDFVLFANSKQQLHEWLAQIRLFLQSLRLVLHTNKTKVFPVSVGVRFLGYKAYPHKRMLHKQNTLRYKRHLRKMLRQYEKGLIDLAAIERSLNSWLGHAKFASSVAFQQEIFSIIEAKGLGLFKTARASWRLLEQ
jgi:retron-type reverse transcriptase